MKPLKKALLFCITFTLIISSAKENTTKGGKSMTLKKLTHAEAAVLIEKGTERPFSGKYNTFNQKGFYLCKQCGTPLFRSSKKFTSTCGWPAFEKAITGSVRNIPDPDGRRTENVCTQCGGHLGHLFIGEHLTTANKRYCVNSISLDFVPEEKMGRAIFASGCFWGTEYFLQKADGVLQTTAGYTGGTKTNPSYKDVCKGTSGHAEAVEVLFDPKKTTFETLTKLFFETHNPEQINRQGPDIGTQYRSVIFYTNDAQKKTAEKLIAQLKKKGLNVATTLTKSTTFWEAEPQHQDYYLHKQTTPYCHIYEKKF